MTTKGRDLSGLKTGLQGLARPPATPAPAVVAPQRKPRTPRTRTAVKPPPKPVEETTRDSCGIGLPVPLVPKMTAASRKARLPYGDWLMSALDRQWEALEQVYPPLPARRPELPPLRRPPRRTVQGGRQTVNFRLTAADLRALDARCAQLQVESRSEFVTTIVELELKVAAKG